MILYQLSIGLLAIAVTVTIHASFMIAAIGPFRHYVPGATTYFSKALIIVIVVLWFFLSTCIQCWFWSGLLLWLKALGSFEEALYFTTVTFSTLGYGDSVLGPKWRLLGAFAATNGTIIIGWTTAMIFVAVQRVFEFRSRL